jgi:Protein of unknown function (DUF3300)
MKKRIFRSHLRWEIARSLLAILCATLLVPGDAFTLAIPVQAGSGDQDAALLPPDQLDSLVAPIALYPDPLLAQTLAASTYPLEIVQLQQWLMKNTGLKDKALEDAVAKQPWDPSVQSMAALPDVVKRLADDVQWTTELGNAFLAQQNDVMDAVQRMRAKAQGAGNLRSNEQQKVETKVVESKTVIVVEQANPQVVYVPTYTPSVVYGPPVYPYPPIYYPPPGYYAAGMAISFGVGLAIGAAWGGGWGYGCGWGGHNNVTINNNNNFVRNSNSNVNRNINRSAGGGGNNWQHNPQHRGGAPYGDRNSANKFGGTTRGSSAADRQTNARQNQAQRNSRQGGAGDRGGAGGGNRAGGGAGGGGNRTGGGAGSGSDRIGNQRVSPSTSGSKGGAFGGASSGQNGRAARASSQRGSSSMGGSRGGGGRRR